MMQLPEGFVLDTPKPKTAPSLIRGNPKPVDPYKEQDQQMQVAKFQLDQEKNARDAQLDAIRLENEQLKLAEAQKSKQGSLDPKTLEGQKNISSLVLSAAGVTAGKDPVADLIRNSTSGWMQSRGADLYGAATGEATEGMEAIGRLQTIANDMVLQMSGGSLGAQISDGDRKFIAARMGDVGNPEIPYNQRLAAWDQVKQRLQSISGGTALGDATKETTGLYIDPAMIQDNGKPIGMTDEGVMLGGDTTAIPIESWRGPVRPGYEGAVSHVFVNKQGQPVGYQLNQEMDGADSIFFFDPSQQPPDNTPPSGGGLGSAFMSGVGDIVEGAGDVVGLVANPLNAGINALFGTNLGTDLGRSARDLTGIQRGNRAAEAINRGAIGALIPAAGANALAQGAVRGGNAVINALAQKPIQQGLGGATAGLSAELAQQAGGGPIVQAGAALAGGLAGYGGANTLSGVRNALSGSIPAESQAMLNQAKQAGLPLMTTDIMPPKTKMGKLAQTIGENIPIAGTGGPRAAQQVKREEAVKNLMAEFGADDAAVDAVSKDLVKTRGAMIGRLTDAKKSIIKGIPGPVPAPKAVAEIDSQIARLKGIDDTAFKPVIDRLQGFKTALQQGKSLEQIEGQRKLLGDLFADTSLAAIKGDGQKAINAIYKPLKDDMGAFIEQAAGPDAKAKWSSVNERLSAMAGELDSAAFKGLLNKAETTPEAAASIIFGKTPSDMKRLYGSLSDKGREKVQSAILFQAAEKAKVGDTISPQKFATAMEAMSKATGVFFSPADKAKIDGVTRLLKMTQRASEAGANPMTGAQNTPMVAGMSFAAVFGSAALPATALAGLLARAYESAPVRNALLRIGRTRPGSPQEQKAITSAYSIMAANDNLQGFVANIPESPAAAAAESDNVGN